MRFVFINNLMGHIKLRLPTPDPDCPDTAGSDSDHRLFTLCVVTTLFDQQLCD